MKIFHVSFRSLCVSALLVVVSSVDAQTPVDLSGTVYDQDNKPRVGVIVSLASDLADTTGADGKWSIQGQFVAVKPIANRSVSLRWLGGDLVTQFDVPTLVSADLFDASGRRLVTLPARMVLAGLQSIPLNLPVTSGVRWLRVRTANTSTVLSARSGLQAPSIALPAGLARSLGIVDKILSYSFQGQVVTEEQLPSLIQSGLLKWIQDYRVSAPISLDSRVRIDSVWAWFKGGSMAQPIRARMACDTINQLISGRVYTVKSQDPAAVYAFRTWINVYGNGNHLTAISDTIGFTTLFGDIAWTRGFSLGNAFPDGKIVSADSVEAGNGLNLSLRLAYLDTASHRVKDSVIKAEWDLGDGLGWRASASLPPVATAKWNAPGVDTVKLRVMDKDSNVAILVKAINVVNSGSALRLTSRPIDTVITPSDTVSFQLYARDTSGVAKVIWSYGDGKFDTTKTGSVHAVKHGYPGPSVVLAGKDSTFALTVTVIDSLGGSTTQKLSSVKVANVVLAGTVTGATSGLVNTVYPFAVAVIPAGKMIAHAEWDLGDGQGWRAGSATGYSAKWLKPGSYSVKVRLTDKDSNAVVLTASPIAITNTKSTVGALRDTIITPSDTVTFALTVADVDGVANILWNFGDGLPLAMTTTGSLKRTYPGANVVPVNTTKRCTLSVQVIDLLGDTTQFARVTVVKVTNDMPRMVSMPDTFSYVDSTLHLTAKATDLGKIVRYEWSTDGQIFGAGQADSVFKIPHEIPPNFRVYVRATDENGNVSKPDTLQIIVYDFIVDSRDGQRYKTIWIGSQNWMAQNLNYRNSTGSTDTVGGCYDYNATNCTTYGRLYNWAEVMALSNTYNSASWGGSDLMHQGVCPSDWHVPSDTEWTSLTTSIGDAASVGVKLKSISGWIYNNGEDSYRFRALPGGYRTFDGSFSDVGSYTFFWSSSESYVGHAWSRYLHSGYTYLTRYDFGKVEGYSVRCLKD